MEWKNLGSALTVAGTIGFVLGIIVSVSGIAIFVSCATNALGIPLCSLLFDFSGNVAVLLLGSALALGLAWGPFVWAIGRILVGRSEQDDEREALST